MNEFFNQVLNRFKLKKRNEYIVQKSAVITAPTGRIGLDNGPVTFVVVVGPHFDQNVPNALMTCRIGYCRAFEKLGIPYVIVDVNELSDLLPSLVNPFYMVLGDDYRFMKDDVIRVLRKYPHFVWCNPWFKESDKFFQNHDLNPSIWSWSKEHRRKILTSEPKFLFTATVEGGLSFFDEWERHGLKVVSLPLACDTTLYKPSAPHLKEFEGISLAFVGGYWKSKGQQIDRYLRSFEDELVIYGYNEWPYRGYRRKLSRESEPSLYRQARVCPTINEPTVRLLHGQINERVFKILGSRGVTVVDAVPAYRELFGEDELPLPRDEHEFADIIREMLNNEHMRSKYGTAGFTAVISRHTYVHRAKKVLHELELDDQLASNGSGEKN